MVLATWFSRRIPNLTRKVMGSAYAAYHNGSATASSPYTVTAMGRWSILNKQLPGASIYSPFLLYPMLCRILTDCYRCYSGR